MLQWNGLWVSRTVQVSWCLWYYAIQKSILTLGNLKEQSIKQLVPYRNFRLLQIGNAHVLGITDSPTPCLYSQKDDWRVIYKQGYAPWSDEVVQLHYVYSVMLLMKLRHNEHLVTAHKCTLHASRWNNVLVNRPHVHSDYEKVLRAMTKFGSSSLCLHRRGCRITFVHLLRHPCSPLPFCKTDETSSWKSYVRVYGKKILAVHGKWHLQDCKGLFLMCPRLTSL